MTGHSEALNEGSTPAPARRILVVEDVDMVRAVVIRMLQTLGYTVHAAADGLVALDVLGSHDVELVLSDLSMPRMDGQTLGREIAARWPTVRVVFMTGHSDPDCASGLQGPLLMKPFSEVALTMAIRQALQVH